jgi:beta-lactamase superfamily II metal-dependent hydrolase
MNLEVYFHNVGHGQAIHIFTPAGESVVVDLGCSNSFSPLEWLRGITDTVDCLVITHPHGDHIAEILNLTRFGFNVRQLWRPNWLNEAAIRDQNQASYTPQLNCYLAMSSTYNYPIPASELVGDPAVSSGLTIGRFAARDCGESNINNHSFVVVLEYLGVKLLIPGDNEPPSWRSLLTQPGFRAAVAGTNVFMPSHHGRESGYCSDLFDLFKPDLSIISDREVCDTDASDKYRQYTTGWSLRSRSTGQAEKRYVVTTRCDGMIHVQVYPSGGRNWLAISGD